MEAYETLNQILVHLFNDIMTIEHRALITDEFKDITYNDMHIIEAIGTGAPKNMSSVARAVSVTTGTLTIAVNSLVRKGYVKRVRSEEDRRVVLVSLTDKGYRAYQHHANFHEEMIRAVRADMSEEELAVLVKSLKKLDAFFSNY